MQLNNIIEAITENKVSFVLLIVIFFLIILLLLCLRDKKTNPKETSILEDLNKEPESNIESNVVQSNTDELLALEKVSKELESLSKPKIEQEVSSYEAEQEEKAIISYDELLSQTQNVSISYSTSETNDDITIKKVDLEKTNKIELDPIKKELNSKVSLYQYEHEEEFLNTLKKLQKLLN